MTSWAIGFAVALGFFVFIRFAIGRERLRRWLGSEEQPDRRRIVLSIAILLISVALLDIFLKRVL
jgi:hypothetical protein